MKFFHLGFISILALTFACSKANETITRAQSEEHTAHGEKNHSYYTCSMHPQIHEHKPGNCPICGMPLIKVSKTVEKEMHGSIKPSDYQRSLIQIPSYIVERKDVAFEIPVGGKHLSASQVAFYIYESDLLRVRPGQLFEGKCPSMPEIILHGKITSIDTIADPATRAVRVLGTLTSRHDMRLMEGSFFGKIFTPINSVVMVPYDSVLRTGADNFVYQIQSDGTINPVKVKLGFTKLDEIEILDGLSGGEKILSGPNFLIDSESKLKSTGMNMEGM
jgi:hypothetical protein